MGTINEDLNGIKAIEDKLTSNKVANFAYTDHAYNNPLTEADGVEYYDPDSEQNIPVADASVMNVNETVLSKGWRSQASSLTRMLMNHFLGRVSYNLNKLNENMSSLLTTLISHIGSANGIAPLNANGLLDITKGGTNASTVNGARTNLNINNVVNTGDSATPVSGGTTKFTTGGAYTELNKKVDKSSVTSTVESGNNNPVTSGGVYTELDKKVDKSSVTSTVASGNNNPVTSGGVYNELVKKADLLDLATAFSTATTYAVGDYVTYNGDLYRCTVAHSAGAWNASNFTAVTVGGDLSNKADKSSLAVPSDAVLHYSFDDLPDMPDGTAVARFTNGNTYELQSTDYALARNGSPSPEITNSNGNVKVIITGGTYTGVWIGTSNTTSSPVWNKIVKIKINVTQIVGSLQIISGLSTTPIKTITKIGTYDIVALHNNDSYNKAFFFWLPSSGNSCTFTVEEIYIGDGSYSTPVIDNSGNSNHSTNNGAIAVQGVSGKAGYFLNGKYSVIQDSNFTLIPPYSYSIWLNLHDNFISGQVIVDGRISGQNNEDKMIITANMDILVGGPQQVSTSTQLTHNQWANITIVCTETTTGNQYKIFINGRKIKTDDTSAKTSGFMSLSVGGRYSNLSSDDKSAKTVDDFLIFNRALSEEEVTALYLNKANTPKYYNLNNYKIDNANVAEEGGTGKYIESIKQEDGQIVPVEQTIDTAPVRASTKPITSGSMYNFFGGNTDAKSWLSKAFGWAMGRDWNCCFQTSGELVVTLNRTVYTIYHANNLWVAGSDHGIIWSEDGKLWHVVSGTALYTFKHIYYANGMWVACSTGQSLWWSTDGKTWTQGDGVNTNYSFNHVYYEHNIWVACSESHGMYWSSNGKTWTQGTGSNTTYTFNDVYYGNNIWVACSTNYGLWWSSDGKAWTQGTGSNTTYTFNSVHYADNIWVAGSYIHGVWRSSDGKAWDSSNISPSNVNINCIYYANGMWQACSESKMYYSFDGKSFKSVYNPFLADCRSVYYANGTWVAATDKGLIWSINGENWQLGKGDESNNYSQCQFLCVYFAKNYWLAGGIYDHFVQGFWYSDFDLVELKD